MPERRPSLPWIRACVLGELIGIATATLVALLAVPLLAPDARAGLRWLALALALAVGLVEGGALGYLQWRVLRRIAPRLRASEWVGVTMAVGGLGWLAGMAAPILASPHEAPAPEPGLGPTLLMAAAIGAAAGFVFGGAQWLVARRHFERAGRWVAIHVPAWAAAMTAIFAGLGLPDSQAPTLARFAWGATGGLAAGLILGLVTAPVASRLHPWVAETDALQGRVCAVTGATSGIGFEVALGLARLGGSLVLLCRDEARGEATAAVLRARVPGAAVAVVRCDLESLSSVRAAALEIARRHERLDLLVHDAGAVFPHHALSADGIERTFALDVIGPFLLTRLLRDALARAGGRVITLAGISYRRGTLDLDDLDFQNRRYDWQAANAQAQLARVLLTRELARRDPAICALAVHPGAVLTRALDSAPAFVRLLVHTVLRPAFVRAELGALPVLRLATAPSPPNGAMFDRFVPTRDDPLASSSLAESLWNACERRAAPAPATG